MRAVLVGGSTEVPPAAAAAAPAGAPGGNVALLAAVAGVMAGLVGQIRPGLGFELLLPLFAAAILGGIGSVWGAVAGGLIVGLAESFSAPLLGAEYRAATAFIVLIAILLLRPRGLFGEKA